MNTPFLNTCVTRRTALATLGWAGLGLAAMPFSGQADKSSMEEVRKLLPKFNEKSCKTLAQLLKDPGFSGQIPAVDVAVLAQSEKVSIDDLMLALLPLAQSYFRAPISNYPVGVVARGVSGSLYLGANLEIPGHSLGFSVHSEQSALSNAYMHSERGVAAMAVTAAPCGHCRQFMFEMVPHGQIRILVKEKSPTDLASLLPSAFGPKDLGAADGAFPVKETSLALTRESSDDLTLAALDAARKSYAPYTKAHSGVAIATTTSRIIKGAYVENAAFNPSLPPLQTALAALILAGEKYAAISRVMLAEIPGALISQKAVTEDALGAITPGTRLEIVTLKHVA